MKFICVSIVINYRPTKDKILRGYFDLYFLLSGVILCMRADKFCHPLQEWYKDIKSRALTITPFFQSPMPAYNIKTKLITMETISNIN